MRSANDSIRFFLRDRFGLSEEARLAEKMLSHVRLKTDMFLALMRQYSPQVAAFNLYGSDKLAHRFWHYMDEESFPNIDPALRRAWGDVIHRYYQETDRALGQILNILPKDCTVLLVSDHGFKADLAAPRQFFLNIGELLDTLDYRDFFHHSTIERRAILDPIVDDEDFIEEMISRLNDIHFKDDDEPVFLTEIDEEGRIVLRTNFSVTWHPESPLLTNDTIVIENQVFPVSRLFFDRTFSGTHDPAGVVLLAGPAIVPGAAIQDAGLLDIAPTALYLLDLPISRELPGRILQEAFTQDYRETRVPRYVERYDPLPPIESDETQIPEHYLEHLRSLNYAQ